ncbi:hypothetical protein [Oceaniferula spumae]
MAYRSNREGRIEWNQFLVKYKDQLITLGIPDIAFRSERDWFYFIEHEFDHQYPDLLNLSNWSRDEKLALLPVFEDMHEEGFYAGDGSGVLYSLRAIAQ